MGVLIYLQIQLSFKILTPSSISANDFMTLLINQKEDFFKKLKCEVGLTSPISFRQHVELPLGFGIYYHPFTINPNGTSVAFFQQDIFKAEKYIVFK